MAKKDSHFINVFSAILGVLIVIAIGLLALSFAGKDITEARLAADPLLQAGAVERIRPFGRVAVAGQDNSALTVAAPGAAAAVPAISVPADGPAAYAAACAVCHGAGIGGAPRTGDAVAWVARVAQGQAVLYKHAIEGYQGSAGLMPAKGGHADYPDQLVRDAVDHMVNQSR